MARTVCGPGGGPVSIEKFDFNQWNDPANVWEVRAAGVDSESSWESSDNPQPSLSGAVKAAFPHYQDHGLTLEQAARICLDLGLVVGTGLDPGDLE